MVFKRPGVFVEETTLPSVTSTQGGVSTGVLLAPHPRGPVEPSKVASWTDFRRKYGGFDTGPLAFAAFLFFHNGGGDLWVKRVEGTGGAEATRTLNDRAGTPVPTLQVDALNSGTWGNSVYVEITDSGVAGRFNLTVYDGGTTNSNRVERWLDLTMDDADPKHVEKVINHPTVGSNFITVLDLDSTSASPDDTPALQAATALAGGTAATTSGTDITDALAELDQITAPFTLNIPDEQDVTILGAAVTYCEDRGDAMLVIDPAATDSVADAVAFANGLTPSSYSAVYYPHLYFSDPSSNERNAVRLLPPGGAVLGLYASTDGSRGVHKSPAGLTTRVRGAAALPLRFTPANLDDLNDSNVNAIRNVPGSGIVVMGARTLSDRLPDRHISVRRSLNHIKAEVKDLTEFAIFEPNDENLWATIRGRVGPFLRGFWQEGGLRGATAEEAFYIKCDAELNTDAIVESGEVRLEIGVATQRPAEFVIIRVGQWQGGQNTEETA